MRVVGHSLSIIGRRGPALLVLSLLLGALCAPLATAAYRTLPVSAFLLTLGSFLSASLSPAETRLGWRRILLALTWIGLGVPLIVAMIVFQLHLNAALEAGVLLSVLAPPVGSAAAIAAILGLQPRLALATSIVLTLIAPLSMPIFATALGANMAIDMAQLAWRLTLIIGSAAALAQIARHWRSKLQPILPDQTAAAGIAVIGLIIVGLAMMSGVRAHWANDPDAFTFFALAAIGVNLGAGLVGALLFASWGAKDAFTIGLVSGNRNVTLAWAAAGSTLPAATEAYVAACVLPVLALPLVVKTVIAIRTRFHKAAVRSADAPSHLVAPATAETQG